MVIKLTFQYFPNTQRVFLSYHERKFHTKIPFKTNLELAPF